MQGYQAKLSVVFFKENGKFVAYCPPLDLSSCGKTFEQAKERIAEALDLFLQEAIKMGTIDDVLQDCGWRKTAHPRKHWEPPVYVGEIQQEVQLPLPK